jgi:hypothetical protein
MRSSLDGMWPVPQNGAVPTVLIELPGGEGVVRRDDGEIVITHDVRDGRGAPLDGWDHRPAKDWLDEGRSLVGGLLPPGAVSAEVADHAGTRVAAAVGGGAYVAILHQPNDGHEPVVCCRDGAGQPVARLLPPDWTRTEVTDAEVPCPACGAVAWDEVLPTDGSRGGRGVRGDDGPLEPCRITVCRICGHEEGAGLFISRFGSSDDEPEDEASVAERRARCRAHQRAQKWYSDKLTLRAVAFPIYAAEDWYAQIGGSGSQSGDGVGHLTVEHYTCADAERSEDPPRLRVTTSVEDSQFGDSQLRHARSMLEMFHHDSHTPWPDVSDAALKVWLGVRDRERRGAAYAATLSEQLITIDGTPEAFLTLTTPTGRWVAVRRHDGLTITVAAHDLDPTTITLEPIPDPATRLLGPEPEDP